MLLPLLVAAAAVVSIANALTSSLRHATGFVSTPKKATMYVYIPTSKLSKPPVAVAVHHCAGTGPGYFSKTQTYAQYADTHGFIVIYPNAPSTGRCWDVSSTVSLTHNGGVDSQTIFNTVKYAETHYGADTTKVYMTGSSSGAMMANVLAGAYPDVFKAATLYGGVPDGQYSSGKLIKTAKQWGDQVRSYYSGYTGTCPKMMIYHETIDTTLYYANFGEELKQWSNVLGISFNRNQTNTPISGYTKIFYGDGTKLAGIFCSKVGHTQPIRTVDDLTWFNIL